MKGPDGIFRLYLNSDEYCQFSVVKKLSKMWDSQAIKGEWSSPEEKLAVLCKESRGTRVIGVAASEALTVGGQKNLMWIDIDTYNIPAVEMWLKEQTMLAQDSLVLIPSTTGKAHVYVATDVPLIERFQIGARDMLRDSMPGSIAGELDRVYGPYCSKCIFLPRLSLLEATLPQHLMRGVKGTTRLPIDAIEDAAAAAFSKRRAKQGHFRMLRDLFV